MSSFCEFPASAATTLVEGYCNDFIQLAASLAQTLEQATMRKIDLGESAASLQRVERGMRDLADAIAALLESAPGAGAVRPQAPTPAPPAGSGLLGDRQPLAAKPAPPQPAASQPASPQPAPSQPAATRPAASRPAAPQPAAPMAGPARPAARHSTIQGSTDSMPMTSVFQFLTRMRKCGTLHVHLGDEHLRFEVADGYVVNVRTNRPPAGERIGELLVERGFVRPEQIAALIKGKRFTVRELGTQLVRAKRLTVAQLQDTLRLQAQRRLQRVLQASSASYEFVEGRVDTAPDHMQIRVPLQPRPKR